MKKGVTLIELVTIIALIFILSSILIPASSAMRHMTEKKQFEGTAMTILEDMRNAKVRALSKGAVLMRVTLYGYTLTDCYSMSVYKRVSFQEGICVDKAHSTIPGDGKIYFKESGSVSPYACSLVITDDGGNSSTISIRVATFTIDFKDK